MKNVSLMKYLLLALLVICTIANTHAQSKPYKEYVVCTNYETHKGKKNHGQQYCVAWATIRENKDGGKDTVGWMSSDKMFMADEYENYQNLPERGKYIVDSLKEDGITQYQNSYLTYEPIYMKKGRKVEELWQIVGQDVKVYDYLFWNNEQGNGIRLLKEYTVK